jgi:hypothetical protein
MRKPTLLQRLRAKKRNQSILVGVTWYSAASWAEVKATATDPECFEDSFPAWEKMANLARRELQRSGVRAIECLIVPQDFFAWCEFNNNRVNNAAARAEFVSETLSAAGATKT